jgi:hypothetical protein
MTLKNHQPQTAAARSPNAGDEGGRPGGGRGQPGQGEHARPEDRAEIEGGAAGRAEGAGVG